MSLLTASWNVEISESTFSNHHTYLDINLHIMNILCRNIGYLDALETYVHLRIIDLGQNKLKSCLALQHIQNLLLLNLEDNLIESLTEIPDFPFLQALNLRRNRIKSSEGLLPNCMAYLHLAGN